jgi:hypothetical protein
MRRATAERTTFPLSADDKGRVARSKSIDGRNSVRNAKSDSKAFLSNLRVARTLWGPLSKIVTGSLRELTRKYGLSVVAGDLLLLEGRWYVTHAGLLQLGQRKQCSGINATLQKDLSDPSLSRWVFRATVYKSSGSRGFVGYGDADPSNCSALVHGAEMRVAETRAVNRALRKAYGIGLCSVEELGGFSKPLNPSTDHQEFSKPRPNNRSANGQPRLRDQLCLLIRQYNLDPTLVKAYAADFCGTETLSGASRDLVESFIAHLAAAARENRDALLCKLNSYAQPQEAKS